MYNGRTITYNDDHVTLATTGDRVTAEYVLPHDDEDTPFEDYWNEDEWEKKEATLHKRTVNTTSTLPLRKTLNLLLMSRPRTEWFSA